MSEKDDAMVRRLASELRERGFATPALMLVDMASPVSYLGEQFLLAFSPLLPFPQWRDAAQNFLAVLRDDHRRALLQDLLED